MSRNMFLGRWGHPHNYADIDSEGIRGVKITTTRSGIFYGTLILSAYQQVISVDFKQYGKLTG
ncbi:MAG: hypothetical protein AAF985_22145, partial [Bacteroidota bacterium]